MQGYVARKDDRYYAVIYEGIDPITGRERRRWHPAGTDRFAAQQIATELAERRYQDGGRERGSLTMAVYLTQRWLPSKQLMLRTSTWDSYRRVIDLHVIPRVGRVPLRHLRPDHLERLYAELLDVGRADGTGGLHNETVVEIHTILRRALDDAVRRGLILTNPAKVAHAPKRRTRSTFASCSASRRHHHQANQDEIWSRSEALPAPDTNVSGPARRPPIFGPEPWATVAGVLWCHFDRWFALVAVTSFDGDLDALERELVGRVRASLHGRTDVEAKLSHLVDLRGRMATAGVGPALLAGTDGPDQATLTKARRKVLDQALEGRAMTEAMRDTPRVRLERRARYGHWDQFPAKPSDWYEKLAGRRPASHVTKGRSFAVTGQLRERLARFDGPRRALADRLALYRAFHTVGIELAERGNDSYGNIGELRLEAFRTYLSIDWAARGIEAASYWQDLCELLVSEVYALTYQHETLPFKHASAASADLIERILLELADEWRAAYQDFQADQALQLIAWLHLAGQHYTRYTQVAHRLGSNHWQSIQALAESALAAGRHDVAVDVFRAADQPGMHRDHLRRRCLALTGVQLDDGAPRLRVVDDTARSEQGW